MVIRQHQPVPLRGGANQRDPEGRLVGEVADRGALGGAKLLNPLSHIAVFGAQIDEAPRHLGIGRDDLHRLVELWAESGDQIRMPADHGVHRFAQPMLVERRQRC